MGEEGGEVPTISVEKFLSQSAEKHRRGILYCCSNTGYRKCLDRKGGYQDFPSKMSYLTVPNISVGESFIFALYSGTENVWIRRWEYQDFPSRNFCLTVPKIYVGESFTVALFFDSEKVWVGG